jgi:indole-3-glycerol phosphate synthase
MADFLDVLARDAAETIRTGYYEMTADVTADAKLTKAICESTRRPIITEIKTISPSVGALRQNVNPAKVAEAMETGGAVGISVLTEPKHFAGSLASLLSVRKAVRLPILMKDIILSPAQLDTAANIGANAVLLITTLFARRYCECEIHDMIAQAHARDLEVLLETHTENEFAMAAESDADMIGINNRDLQTLTVDLGVTKRILEKRDAHGKIVVSESGITTLADLRFLSDCGVDAFLIGTAVMVAENIKRTVQEFVLAR